MPVVHITIRNTSYAIACDNGQEDKLKHIAERLDLRVNALAANLGRAGETQLLLMTALMMEDQISELKKNLQIQSANNMQIDNSQSENAVADTIDAIADYIENLANNLEKA
jgi:cell division protein ZapA